MDNRKLDKENKKSLCFPYAIESAACSEDEKLLQPKQLSNLARIFLLFRESGSELVTEDKTVMKRHTDQLNRAAPRLCIKL